MEAKQPPLTLRLRELALLYADKWSKLHPNDQRSDTITANVAFRLRCTDWRELVLGLDAQSSQSNTAP